MSVTAAHSCRVSNGGDLAKEGVLLLVLRTRHRHASPVWRRRPDDVHLQHHETRKKGKLLYSAVSSP